MTETATGPAAQHDERPTWNSLLLGAAVWFLHLNIVYGLASLACKWGWLSFEVAGISGLQWVEIILTLIAVPLMLLTIYFPWRDWRSYQSQKPADNPRLLHDTEKDRRPMLAFITLLLNSLFLLFVIATFVPVFALNPCG